MPALLAARTPRPRPTFRGGRAPALLLTAGVAAAFGYALHHLGPFEGHPTLEVLAAVLAAALGSSVLGAVAMPVGKPTAPLLVLRGGQQVAVTPLRPEVVGFCAALHAEALPHGFFVDLGQRFLRRYYRTFIDSPHAVAVVATVDGHAVGYLVGMLHAREHARWVLRRRGGALAVGAGLAFASRPGSALRFVRTRVRRYVATWRRHAGAPTEVTDAGGSDVAVLSHVAVLGGARGSGAGQALVKEFERAAREAGAETAFLTTLEGDQGAGDFYAALGWQRGPLRRTPDGLDMREWRRALDEAGT